MTKLIFKIVPRREWVGAQDDYRGSAHDQKDGFLHFSTSTQLAETLRHHYAGQNDLLLIAVEAKTLGNALKWEYAPSRGEHFPHLYGPLPKAAALWAKPLREKDGQFLLPGGAKENSP